MATTSKGTTQFTMPSGGLLGNVYKATNAGLVQSGQATYNSSGGITGTSPTTKNISINPGQGVVYSGGGSSYSSGGGGVSSSYNYVPPATTYSAGTKVNTVTPVATTMDAGAISNAGAGTTSVNIGSAPASAYNPSVATAGNIATGLNPDGSAKVTATTGTETAKTSTEPSTLQEAFTKYVASKEADASLADAQNMAQEQTQLLQKQVAKNNISNSLNAETTRMNLDLQNLRGVGAREGVTEAVYGQQSAEVTREAMVRILPLQAQLAMANDDVQLAQQQTDTLFKIYAQDAQNKVDYRNQLKKDNWDFFTAQEKQKLDKQAKIDDFNMKLYGDKVSSINDAANQALAKGNTALYRALTSTPPPQYNGQADFGAKVDAWAKTTSANSAKYASSGTSVKAPTIQKIDGVDMQWDSASGKWVTPTGAMGGATGTLQLAQAQNNINLVNDVLKNPALSANVGPSILGRIRGKGLYALTGDTQNFNSGVQQLVSQLSLDSLIRAKAQGATFGALSDSELKILSSSATKLDNWAKKDSAGNYTAFRTSEKAFKQEMDKIQNLAKLDYLLKSGKPEDVGVVVHPDGTYWTKNSDGTFTELK